MIALPHPVNRRVIHIDQRSGSTGAENVLLKLGDGYGEPLIRRKGDDFFPLPGRSKVRLTLSLATDAIAARSLWLILY